MSMLRRFISDERGLETIEYSLLAVLIALAVVGGATALGLAINARFNATATAVGP